MPYDDRTTPSPAERPFDASEPRVVEREPRQNAPQARGGASAQTRSKSAQRGQDSQGETRGRGGNASNTKEGTGIPRARSSAGARQGQGRNASGASQAQGKAGHPNAHPNKKASAAKRAPKKPQKPAKKIDPTAATIDKPAHPLPAVRMGRIDYDRYLMHETDRFKIFSAEERRARNRHILIGLAIAVVVGVILAWAVVSRAFG